MEDRIKELEEETAQSNKVSEQCEHDIRYIWYQNSNYFIYLFKYIIREIGKRTAHMETSYDEAFSALIATEHKLEEKEKALAVCDQDISSLCRYFLLYKCENNLCEFNFCRSPGA